MAQLPLRLLETRGKHIPTIQPIIELTNDPTQIPTSLPTNDPLRCASEQIFARNSKPKNHELNRVQNAKSPSKSELNASMSADIKIFLQHK